MVLTGASSKFCALVRGLAAALPSLLAQPRAPAGVVPLRQEQRRLTQEQVAQLVSAYQAGGGVKELGCKFKIHRETVGEHLKRVGVRLRQRGLTAEQIDGCVRLYGEGWSTGRLGKRYEVDAETVRAELKKRRVQMRRPWERI